MQTEQLCRYYAYRIFIREIFRCKYNFLYCFCIIQTPYGAPGPDHRPEGPPPLTEQEFEEIMGRNRTVSSSAIARAVSDAAAGEYASAIETLVTAISLIKQSKVAADDRCKILISSLQDTLRGVETKSYGSGRRGELNISACSASRDP